MNEKKYVGVPIDLVNQIMDYISRHPYVDVAHIMDRLKNECVSIESPGEKTETDCYE